MSHALCGVLIVCVREDYDLLDASGVDIRGKVALVRYGSKFRGVKVLIAQERGAKGVSPDLFVHSVFVMFMRRWQVLIYSDPIDDGFVRGNVFPNGPWRPQQGVQRGSVQFSQICPGDPRRTLACLNDASAVCCVRCC